MQIADILRIWRRIIEARGTDKEGDQPSIARVEIEVHFIRHIEIGLLEDKRHSQHALIEINDGFTIGTDKRNVMNSLRLDF